MKQSKMWLVLLLTVTNISLYGQLSIPEIEAVYGGRINAITGFEKSIDTSVIFITTESANTAFFTKVKTSTTPTFEPFKVIPALDATAGYGGQVQLIDVVEHSESFIFAVQGSTKGLYYTNPPYTSIQPIYTTGMISDFIVVDSMVYWINADQLFWGKFDAAGNYLSATAAPISISSGGMIDLTVHPSTGMIYLFHQGTKSLYKSSDAWHSFSASTTFSAVSLGSTSTAVDWRTLGIAPDGRIFLGGSFNSGSTNKWIAYTDDEITWTDFDAGIGGIHGSVFAFMGNSSTYNVGYGSMYSNNKGQIGTWNNFGNMRLETHPNDGVCFSDPTNFDIVYMTTDQGIGASVDKGVNIFEINDGVEAVQVQDFDMLDDKNTAWLSAKSGVRRVTNYQTSPTWTNAIFPMGDGSPYFSIEMNKENPDTIFAGNARIYRTENDGVSWSRVFTAENAPYNYSNLGTEVQAIEICDFSKNIIMAGYIQKDAAKGGLFVSNNYGDNGSWSQILLNATTNGADVDVYDIEFVLEGSDTVAYVGVAYDLSAPTGRSVYRVVKNGTTWTASQDMTSSTTSTGTLIVASIMDIEVNSTSDTIFVTGTDAGINHPICYYKPLNSSGLWTPFTTLGFPFITGKKGKAITLGIDTLYCAVDNEVYIYPMGGAAWSLGYSYPTGTEINFLFYYDLLAGTNIGLFEHPIDGILSSNRRVGLPTEPIDLMKIYPNPVYSQSIVEFEIPRSDFARLAVYDMSGKEIYNVAIGYFDKGSYKEVITTKDLAKGVYLITLSMKGYQETKKLVIAR